MCIYDVIVFGNSRSHAILVGCRVTKHKKLERKRKKKQQDIKTKHFRFGLKHSRSLLLKNCFVNISLRIVSCVTESLPNDNESLYLIGQKS